MANFYCKNCGTESSSISCLNDLLTSAKKLKVPPYQRAFAWEETQLNQFASDILEIEGSGGYYYGHFILEEIKKDEYEIIDGQQRITTFILFLMVCRFYGVNGLDDYINKFETVDYDQASFEIIRDNLELLDEEWSLEDFEFLADEQQTLSISRILFALNHFRKLFTDDKKLKVHLKIDNISNYLEILQEAHISIHIPQNKAVAVQIFELHNTRGIRLKLVEKVKSKLMKAVYLNADIANADTAVKKVQDDFATIYRFEESAKFNAFKGDLSLEEILLHHLRIIDDGSKLFLNDKHVFNSPSKFGNREEAILSYIDKQITEKENVLQYIEKLTTMFKETVALASNELLNADVQNNLIGDTLILDKSLSMEFYILMHHKGLENGFYSRTLIGLWEKLLFTRDFHEKYYRKWYRDDFERLFYEVVKVNSASEVESVLIKYCKDGFQRELMTNNSLPDTVLEFLEKNKENIFNSAFYWWPHKIKYLLYKYEVQQSDIDLAELRKIVKTGISVEHILPQTRDWVLTSKEGENVTDKYNTNIDRTINGIGNLLLLTASKNSELSNNQPNKKEYPNIGGSYSKHNADKDKWNEFEKWEDIIYARGEEIYACLINFIK